MDGVSSFLRNFYVHAFRATAEEYHTGRVVATTQNWKVHWQNWCCFVGPLGVDLFLQETHYNSCVRCLTRFTAANRRNHYGQGKQVHSDTVLQAIPVVGKTISLACEVNLVKEKVMAKLVPRMTQMLDGWAKEDPPMTKNY